MPFWWNRRNRPWFGTWNRRYKRRYKKRRFARRRRRRPTYGRRRRRRRRRKRKVRRKQKKITVKQWQPDSVVKCKIIGLGCLVAGAEGRQSYCYTNEINEYPQPKAPGGGGFGAELYTLEYLYKQWVARKNIWTRSNDYKDLVRYTGTTITFYRHATTDFIVSYNRQPPFLLEKDYFNDLHPVNMLLKKHHRLIPSLKRKPFGKLYVKMKIRPPKQMLTKWFFQQDFAKHGLFELEACAANLSWGYFGPNTQSRLITFHSLNTNFYKQTDWGQPRGSESNPKPWLPYPSYPLSGSPTFTYPTKGGGTSTVVVKPTDYDESISYDTGFFQWKVLTATRVQNVSVIQHEIPITLARYNPDADTGVGNAVWLTSIIADSHWEQPRDPDLIIVGKPLWLAFFGFYNWIKKAKKDKAWLYTSMFVCKSPAIHLINNTAQTIFPILDLNFITGKMPYDEMLTTQKKKLWFPTVEMQQVVINTFVESGPYIPKYAYLKESTWELGYKYTCYFKWGGPQVSDQPVQDPQKQGKYDVPDTISKAVQVCDPLKQTCKAMLRAWDYRRGIITTTALKRMSANLPTDTSIQSDDSEPEKKKKKVTAEIPHHQEEAEEMQTCLLSLFEENTCQDPTNLQQLINQQREQQHKLKLNLFKVLLDLKKRQRILQLQTGIE